MAAELQSFSYDLRPRVPGLPAVPWRDPHTVPPAELAATIASLEEQCRLHPESADLHTCLGMAYAMNYDAYQAMDALEHAARCEPGHFWAQMKYSELQYRLRALEWAESETLKALRLAGDGREFAVARRQLQEIRRLRREGSQKPAWTKPLLAPAVLMGLFLLVLSMTRVWR